MTINVAHVEASILRFHKSTTVLAEKASGVGEGTLQFYPYIVRGTDGRVSAHTSRNGTPDADFLTPFVVNGSLCLELLLKLIIFYEKNEWIAGHNLIKLYQEVSTESKRKANNAFKNSCKLKHHKEVEKFTYDFLGKKLKWNLAFILEASAVSFENWRYAFEHGFSEVSHKSSFLAYGEAYDVLSEIKNILANKVSP